MTISAERVAVAGTAVALNAVSNHWQRLTIHNAGTVDPADLGDSSVTADDGFPVDTGNTVEVLVPAAEVLFAVSTVTGTTLAVLRT